MGAKPEFMARSMPTLRALRRAREHCDVVFRFPDGAEFWAHRFVLAARYAGSVVSDLSSEMLELLIDLAYQVPIQERVGLHNAREVLDQAEALNIATMRDHCLQLLGNNLEPDNCVGTYQLASSKGYKMLCSDAFRYIVRNFGKWIAGNVEDRRGHLPRLLLLVTLSQEPGSDVSWRTRLDLSERCWLKPRVPKDVLFMFLGWTGGATNHLLTYNCRSSRWLLQPHQKTYPRAYHGVVMLDNLISFVGSFDGQECYHTVVSLDVSWLKWTSRSNMFVARCYISVAVFLGYIYVTCGFDCEDRTSSGERYDAKRNQREFVASMHAVRSDACAAAADGLFYIMGGLTGREVLDSVECYDPLKTAERTDARKGHWSELPSLAFPRRKLVVVLHEGVIYVAGGFDGGTTVALVERNDMQTRLQWHNAPDLTVTCSAAAGLVYQDISNARHWM
ncbi:kelch repeat-containing protein kel-10-like [Haemaphysalis longicornis]